MQGSRVLRSLFVVGPAVAGLAFSGIGVPGVGGADTKPPPSAAPDKAKADVMGKLPISFEANQGQTDPRVKFMSRSANGTLFVTPNEAVLSLPAQAAMSAKADNKADPAPSVLRMKVLGGNPDAPVTGANELPGKINYLDADPAKAHVNVPTYARTETKAVYPGIDMAWYGKGSSMEYDFIVAPGADPSTIALGFEGAKGLRVDKGGDLVMNVGGQEVRQHKPVLYQETAGKKTTVPGRFVLGRDDQVGFSVGSYDASKALVIDPRIVWSTYLGASGAFLSAMDLDSAGNVYVSGTATSDGDFPFLNAYDSSLGEYGGDVFVSKFTSDGRALVYSTFLGGQYNANPGPLAIDGTGSAYIANTSIGTIPTTPGAYQETPAGGGNRSRITKLSPDGSTLTYSTWFNPAAGRASVYALDVDAAGTIHFGGQISFDDATQAMPATFGAVQETCVVTQYGDCAAAYLAKLNPSGNGSADLTYFTYLGSGYHTTNDIEVDESGVAYMTGTASGGDFLTTAGAYARDTDDPGWGDVSVMMLNPVGGGLSDLVYSTVIGGEGGDYPAKVAKGPDGSIYVSGTTAAPSAAEVGFPVTPGAFQTTSIKQYAGTSDLFMIKVNPDPDDPNAGAGDPDDLLYSTLLGSAFADGAGGLAVDANGWAYVGGWTSASTYPVTPNRLQKRCGCFYDFGEFSPADAVISVVNPDPDDPSGDGRDEDDLLFSTWLGGTGGENVGDVELDSRNRIVVAGNGGSIRTTKNAFNRAGSSSTWVAKIDAAIE